MSMPILSKSVRLVPEPPALVSSVIGAPQSPLSRGLDDRPIVGSPSSWCARTAAIVRSGGARGQRAGLVAEGLGVLVQALGIGQQRHAEQRALVRSSEALDDGEPLTGGRLEEAAAVVDLGQQLALLAPGQVEALD